MKSLLSGYFALSASRLALLAAPVVGFVVLPTELLAAPGVFWGNTYERPDLYSEMPPPVRRVVRPPVLPKGAAKAEKIAAEGKKPVGPLVIAVSIQRQNVKVYDSNGLFAESPISSGMAGHSTPMGVFSVIQKNKHHRSNIYSGAPMPYMQRITWSGIAMHAGVLPGYPASHGCIRMPMSFAMKMWGWTRMGARVIVAPGEVSPSDITHPSLAALTPPAPLAEAPASANVRTADASNSIVGSAAKVVTDVTTGSIGVASEPAVEVTKVAETVTAQAASDLPQAAQADSDGLPPLPAPAPVDFSDIASDAGPAATSLAAQAPDADAPGNAEAHSALTVEAPASISAAAAPDIAPSVASPAAEPVVAATALIKRNLPVAIFVSRKDAKIYVRQNFKPVLDMPIEIAGGDKALGTHVFTARAGADEGKTLHWSVVSLPATARQASVIREDHGAKPKRSQAAESAPITYATAEEALARVAIPADLMTRLGEALPSGSSLVVSDQGIAQGETGEGTDFIVRLR